MPPTAGYAQFGDHRRLIARTRWHLLHQAGYFMASGTKVVLNTCSSSTTQVWTPGNAHTLKNEASGLCLAITSVANGANPDIVACTTQTTQQWRLPAM